ncbi:YkgJ family cysteine cluster protein [uncultured Methanomethylovorans sp.]|uniref:YkgJ family cysteine cluster protein n=1 Tax=uncultured Methanomethylovorans sp. TaxID=183759 RepID=UPI003747D49C
MRISGALKQYNVIIRNVYMQSCQFFGMRDVLRLKDFPFFQTIQEILSFYSCPSTCPAICCKVADIDVDEKDRKILKKASIEKAAMIKPSTEYGKHHYRINPPCPFLEHNKCSAYDQRPTICRLFPFNICPNPRALILYPCDVGASLFDDFIEYSNSVLKQPISEKMVYDFRQSHSSFTLEADRNLSITMIGIEINDLIPFKKYLESK